MRKEIYKVLKMHFRYSAVQEHLLQQNEHDIKNGRGRTNFRGIFGDRNEKGPYVQYFLSPHSLTYV